MNLLAVPIFSILNEGYLSDTASKKAVMAQFIVLSQHLPGGTNDNNEKAQNY
jgi:hypothetical protein